ncbi:DUF4339 domain-containing protein [Gimesia chilikensis]|uniref:LamG-like jellyroll fold domain-containing protein n=1 Tax=Gimesia chilikensis TaxID=2605989 RepID=UPI0011EEAD69|nr:LamG-like jellyroll fold domain-containing protein [Gimesia chilikensis]KAA0139129.1 DUF4339 domain-containing protein [Gimesia chilikensis]
MKVPVHFYISAGGVGFGPFTNEQITQFVSAGIVDEDNLVWRKGDETSQRAVTVLDEQFTVSAIEDESAPSLAATGLMWGIAFAIWLAAAGIFAYAVSGRFLDQQFATSDGSRESLKDDQHTANGNSKPELKSPAISNGRQKVILPQPIFSLTFDDDVIPANRITESGARLVDGKIGEAIEFDGRNYIEIPCTLSSENSPRTLSAWIQNSGDSRIMNSHAIACGSDVEGKRVWGIYHANGNWATYGWGRSLEANTHVDREWHFHCISFDGENVVYYVDGENVGEKKAKLDTTAGPMILGTYANRAMGFCFKGLIDEVKVYDVALDKQQVEELYGSYRHK